MQRTPGTISALPSSRHSATLALICSRTSLLLSPVSPARKAHARPESYTYSNMCRRRPLADIREQLAGGDCECECEEEGPVLESEEWRRRAPEKSARKPCERELITSISCSDTVCTTSLRFCSSPSGHCTKRTCAPIAL